MKELLRVAGDESQHEPWARVHAINTLRLTFNDRNLANDVSGFFAEGAVNHSLLHSYTLHGLKCILSCMHCPGKQCTHLC